MTFSPIKLFTTHILLFFIHHYCLYTGGLKQTLSFKDTFSKTSTISPGSPSTTDKVKEKEKEKSKEKKREKEQGIPLASASIVAVSKLRVICLSYTKLLELFAADLRLECRFLVYLSKLISERMRETMARVDE